MSPLKIDENLDELLATRRWCYVIPRESFVEGRGWRVSIAIEGVEGHFPTGDLDFGAVHHKEPWFWGGPEDSYEIAEQLCAEQNQKLGIDVSDVYKIVMSTFRGSGRRGRKPRTKR